MAEIHRNIATIVKLKGNAPIIGKGEGYIPTNIGMAATPLVEINQKR